MSYACTTTIGDEEMVKWILDKFASVVDIQNPNGNLAVHFAAAQGMRTVVATVNESLVYLL